MSRGMSREDAATKLQEILGDPDQLPSAGRYSERMWPDQKLAREFLVVSPRLNSARGTTGQCSWNHWPVLAEPLAGARGTTGQCSRNHWPVLAL